jgi:hypothetical protein
MPMRLKKATKAIAASLAAVVLSLAVGTPAFAYDDYVSTDDGDPGGRVYWTANGDVVKVCDIEADGWAAKVSVGYFTSAYHVHDSYTLQAGGNGTCNTRSAANGGVYDLPEGYQLNLTVCLVSDDYPAGTYCDWIEPYNIN